MAIVPNFIVGPSTPPWPGCGAGAFPAGMNAARSLVAFVLFLEDRDLGFLFLFPEIVPEEKHRAQRQHRQQELEEAFHQNLPSPHFNKTPENVNARERGPAPVVRPSRS
jgi:hypothetical protein